MIYVDNDFYSNFSSIKKSNDDVSMASLFVDQLSNLVAYKKPELIDLFGKVGIKVSEKPSNTELSQAIVDNLATNKKLVIGLSYLIAKENDILQEQLKKGRSSSNFSNVKGTDTTAKAKKPVDWTKVQDSVQTIAGSLSVVSDSLTGVKKGMFADDLATKSNSKDPSEDPTKDPKKDLDKSSSNKKIFWTIGALILVAGIGYYGYKKGWFKGQTAPTN